MNVGEDVVKRRGSRAISKLSDTVQGMMGQWTEEQFPNFVETMELIRKNAPVRYVQLYMEAVKMGIVRQTDININISRKKDRDDLQALVRSRISLSDNGNYVPYEEVGPEADASGTVAGREAEAMPLPTRKE